MFAGTAGCLTSGQGSQPQATAAVTTGGLPAWLPGVWTREWIRRGSTQSNLFDVHYLQTTSVFGDVRFPRNRPAFPSATSFADLTTADLRLLAQQRGFTGHTTVAGLVSTWHHDIDFQPPDGSDDIGRLERTDSLGMYEHALDGSYVESWRALSDGQGRFLAVRVERMGRLERVLVMVGNDFLFVRNRARDLPVAESLDALMVAAQDDRARMIEYLDCEFSTGRVHGGSVPWEIEHSTLPWREGRHLDFVDGIVASATGEALTPLVGSADRWTVPVNTLAKAELVALFLRRP